MRARGETDDGWKWKLIWADGLAGVTLAVKDNLPVAGMPWTDGSAVWRDRVPDEDTVAVARARAAQPDWNGWGIRNRVKVLRRFQQLLLARKADIARRITQEAGKPYVESLLTEVLVVLDAARFLIEDAYSLLREEKLPHGNPALKTKSGRILREPYGVIGIISPWNYPFSIPATEVMAALVAGNAVVLKPSEFTPLIALELQSRVEGRNGQSARRRFVHAGLCGFQLVLRYAVCNRGAHEIAGTAEVQ